MGELRKDYILERWVIVSPKRGQRPHELQKPAEAKEGICYFCPGNENLTPQETGRIVANGGWSVRWFENKFPALKQEGEKTPRTTGRFYAYASSYGHHEIIVETPRHDRQLAQLTNEEIEQILHVYARRTIELEQKEGIKYAAVFKNHGYLAGTSIAHSHSQIMATAIIPQEINEKINTIKKYLSCPYCAIIQSEKNSARFCLENNDFIAFTPYASRYNYEVWVFPKKHIARLEDANLSALAEIMLRLLQKIHKAGIDYNMLIQHGPFGEDFHLHIEICPRLAIWGGFELGTGITINSVSPEEAAQFYREQ